MAQADVQVTVPCTMKILDDNQVIGLRVLRQPLHIFVPSSSRADLALAEAPTPLQEEVL